jgi:hypothetical protein
VNSSRAIGGYEDRLGSALRRVRLDLTGSAGSSSHCRRPAASVNNTLGIRDEFDHEDLLEGETVCLDQNGRAQFWPAARAPAARHGRLLDVEIRSYDFFAAA